MRRFKVDPAGGLAGSLCEFAIGRECSRGIPKAQPMIALHR